MSRYQQTLDHNRLSPLDRAWQRVLTGQQTGPVALEQATIEVCDLLHLPHPDNYQPDPRWDLDDDYWTTPYGWTGTWREL